MESPILQPSGAAQSLRLNYTSLEERLEIRAWTDPELPQLDTEYQASSTRTQMESQLYDNMVRCPFSFNDMTGFWPPKLLEHMVNKRAVHAVLLSEFISKQPGGSVHQLTDEVLGANACRKPFVSIFAILILLNKTNCITSFIDEGISDAHLPIDSSRLDDYLTKKTPPFRGWKRMDLGHFNTFQRMLTVPILSMPSIPAQVCHYQFNDDDRVPWSSLGSNNSSSSSNSDSGALASGGYGEVTKIIIHDWQHRFHSLLQSISAPLHYFALKRLYTTSMKEFEEEATQLTRFGGLHKHIVTLLAKITNRGQHYLLFPWADGDLLRYWQQDPKPRLDHDFAKWVISQIHGLTEALAFIHNPKRLRVDSKNLYGRHGDIKAENVLCFRGRGRGTLVLSDLGLTRTHGTKSRSNRPGENIPMSPDYRPPECDIDGKKGYISRSFDIWTLGCLFIEFVTWALEGWEGFLEFKRMRSTPYIHGGKTTVYFQIVKVKGGNYAFRIKEQVHEQIERLHAHPRCTGLFHDILDLTQDHMLLVESSDESPPLKRISSKDLCSRLSELKKRSEDEAYCLTPRPLRISKRPRIPVQAPLNLYAQNCLSVNYDTADIRIYEGETLVTGARKEE